MKVRIWKHYEDGLAYGGPDEYWCAMKKGEDDSLTTFDEWADAMSYVHRKWLGKPIPAAFFRRSQWGEVFQPVT